MEESAQYVKEPRHLLIFQGPRPNAQQATGALCYRTQVRTRLQALEAGLAARGGEVTPGPNGMEFAHPWNVQGALDRVELVDTVGRIITEGSS